MAPSSAQPQKKAALSPSNLAVGAAVSLFEVTTLGQPFEVLKTHAAANRGDNLRDGLRKTWARGGVAGFYQGLIPWAWIESAAAGAVLLYTASAVEDLSASHGISSQWGGLLGGLAGGVAQAYAVMGVCTTMKTAEVTRQKATLQAAIPGQAPVNVPTLGAWGFFMDTLRREGIRGVNKGVNAVAVRQATNWASRMGFARATENMIRSAKGMQPGAKLSTVDKVTAAAVGGALGCWNHPIEVIRVEMQSLKKSDNANRPAKLTILNTGKYIYQESGIKGLFRGVLPRLGLGIYRTVCLIALGDHIKAMIADRDKRIAATDF